MKTVMIVAGESSGELYGSLLAKQLKAIRPDLRLIGIGGERMRDEGVEILSGISSAFGITELLPSLRKIRHSFRAAASSLSSDRPDVVVLIDFPDFNFRLGRMAKGLGLRVLYYVSPQVWAWRKGRVRTMGEFADRVAVILPFEEEIYRKAGIPCSFVGHPALEEIESIVPAGGAVRREWIIETRKRLGIADRDPVFALLPGSRPSELKTLLPLFVRLLEAIKADFPKAGFILPLAPNLDTGRFRESLDCLERSGATIVRGEAVRCLAAADMAVIASGTAALQAAFLGTPAVVVYKLSPLTYFIGRHILDVRYISLVNILSGREVVRELIQGQANPEGIAAELLRIYSDRPYREGMVSAMRAVRDLFSGREPSRAVARTIAEMSGWEINQG